MAHGVGYYLDQYAVFAGRKDGRVVALVAALPRSAKTPGETHQIIVAQGLGGAPLSHSLMALWELELRHCLPKR